MLFHEGRHIKHAITHRHSRALASLGSIFSRYEGLECANSVQLLIKLQQANLQPCASHGCEVWAPAARAVRPLQELQQLQHAFLRRACQVRKSIPADIVFEELQLVRWPDFWWRCVLQFWSALAAAPQCSVRSHVFRDALALASRGCTHSWAAQVFECLQQHGIDIPMVNGEPVAVAPSQIA